MYNKYKEYLKQKYQNLNNNNTIFNNFNTQTLPNNINIENNYPNNNTFPVFFNNTMYINPFQNNIIINNFSNNTFQFINDLSNTTPNNFLGKNSIDITSNYQKEKKLKKVKSINI